MKRLPTWKGQVTQRASFQLPTVSGSLEKKRREFWPVLLERALRQKNANRWYYRSVPRTVRFLFGQCLIEVPRIIEWIDNRE